MSKKKRKSPDHTFIFTVNVKPKRTMKGVARVRMATSPVQLTLTREHVLASLEVNGAGNAMLCAGAMCLKSQEGLFPHPVAGEPDWFYSRVYVPTKVKADTGLPCECVVYRHSDNVARYFDTTKGQKKLLERIEKDGPITINLYPPPDRTTRPGSPRGRQGGQPRAKRLVGAKLRAHMVELGGVPE